MSSSLDAGSRIQRVRIFRRKDFPKCGAKTRAGGRCLVRAEPGKKRCRFHGGLSTGPKTEAGRIRIGEAQRRRWIAYRESKAAQTEGEVGKDWLTQLFDNPDE